LIQCLESIDCELRFDFAYIYFVVDVYCSKGNKSFIF
jgi:hypothetical protein